MERLNAIFEWDMTVAEAEAFKLCVMWEEQTRRMFPDLRLARIPDKGDPRKCLLFKNCWKLARTTRGLLKPEEYKLYMIANLQIVKVHNGRLEPNLLCGDKAWVRWKVWKRYFEKKQAEVKGEEVPPDLNLNPKIVKELDCTKLFLFERQDGAPTLEKTGKFFGGVSMKLWVGTGKVSFYYLVLSPWVRQIKPLPELEKAFTFDASLYQGKADDGVRAFFKKEFLHEFGNGEGV